MSAAGFRRGKGWINTPEPGKERAPSVLSPTAAALVRGIKIQRDARGIWDALDSLPRGIASWEDLMEVVAELRRQRDWQIVIVVCMCISK